MNTQIVLRCTTINSKKNYISIVSLYQNITKFLKVNWREVFHAYYRRTSLIISKFRESV